MVHEAGIFFLAMALGFSLVQVGSSFWGVLKEDSRYLTLGKISAYIQGGFLAASFLTLILAFLVCDFSLTLVALHDHTQLPWYYRLAATWGNHEGSLLLFVLVLSSISVAFAWMLKDSGIRARALVAQGFLTILFLLFMWTSSNPFSLAPFLMNEGDSLNPLLQDRGLLFHPPMLYIGYVGFSAPFSLALAALWGDIDRQKWTELVRPWVLGAWATLTAGIALGSWWAYYELGWGGWWFWDPVENASFMPWLAGTALLHILRTEKFYRWALFLSLFTFHLSLLGTFLVRSGIVTSVHSFAQSPERGILILSLIGAIVGTSFFIWIGKAPRLRKQSFILYSREGGLLVNSLALFLGLTILLLGTLFPLFSDLWGGPPLSVGAPYFERTLIPLMLPLFILLPLGALFRDKNKDLYLLLVTPLTACLGAFALGLYLFFPLSLWALGGFVLAIWVLGGTVVAYLNKRLSLGATLAHVGVGISLLGVSLGGGLRVDESRILKPQESLEVGGIKLTLEKIEHGRMPTYLYERATILSDKGPIYPEKRLYLPQNSLFSETAITTNGFRDLYVILGPYQGEDRWLIRASKIPFAPWIWIGAIFMVMGAAVSLFPKRMFVFMMLCLLPFQAFAATSLEKRAEDLYKEVRCPVCLGQPLSDSELKEAKELKAFIQSKLDAGESEDAIRTALRDKYGDQILFRPPLQGSTYILWALPFLLFISLLGGLVWKGRE